MNLETKFDIREIVYLRTDGEQLPRIVTAIMKEGDKGLMYRLSQGIVNSWHYDFEIGNDKDVLMSLNAYKNEN